MHLLLRGVHIFEKPCCREIGAMRGCVMRGLLVIYKHSEIKHKTTKVLKSATFFPDMEYMQDMFMYSLEQF